MGSFFLYREHFLNLVNGYAQRNNTTIDRNKIFGVLYDMIFFVGICHLRNISPSMKDIYLEMHESRTTSLRHVETLQSMGIFKRRPDPQDARRTSVTLSPDFEEDFQIFLNDWVPKPRKRLGSS